MPRHRRTKGSGSVYCPQGRGVLYIRYEGRRIATGLPDNKENRKLLLEQLDRAYMRMKLDGINILMPESTTPKTVADAWQSFNDTFLGAKQPKTAIAYETAYNHFFGKGKHPMRTDAVTDRLIQGLNPPQRKTGRQIGKVSLETYLRCVKVFLRWSHKRGYLKTLPDFTDIRSHLGRVTLPDPEIYTTEEIIKIIAWFRKHDPEGALITELAVVTGWRIHEIMELKHDQIKDDHIVLTSKDWRKTERHPIWSESRPVFDRIRKMTPIDGEYVFKINDWKVHYRALLKRLDRAMSDMDIEKRGRGWHEFRKTFISRVARSGMPLDQASRIARCTIETMMRYYRAFSLDELTTSMERMRTNENASNGDPTVTLLTKTKGKSPKKTVKKAKAKRPVSR